MSTIFSGIALGLGLAVLVGPAFFTLLQTSIEKGFKKAIVFALGVFICDLMVVSLVFLGAKSVLDNPIVSNVMGFAGGAVIFVYGIIMFRKKSNKIEDLEKKIEYSSHLEEFSNTVVKENPILKNVKTSDEKPVTKYWLYLVKGFVLNIANPGIWFYWILWVGVISSTYTTDGVLDVTHIIVFLGCTLATVYSTDVLKALAAHKLKNFMTEKFLTRLNKIFGVILFAFGVYLIVSTAYPYLVKFFPQLQICVDWVKGLWS
jgi:threonine/homoserine/homoserine lactone efflux protein